jgi:hypothetical protein
MIVILESIKDNDENTIISQTQHIKNEKNKKILLTELEKILKQAQDEKDQKAFHSPYTIELKKLINTIKKYNLNDSQDTKNKQHADIYNIITNMNSIYSRLTIEQFKELKKSHQENKNNNNQTEKPTETQKYMINILESIKDNDENTIISHTQHIQNEDNKTILINQIQKLIKKEFDDNTLSDSYYYSNYTSTLQQLIEAIKKYSFNNDESLREKEHQTIYNIIKYMLKKPREQTILEFKEFQKRLKYNIKDIKKKNTN